MLWEKKDVRPVSAVYEDGLSVRDQEVVQNRYARSCERWLDHWYGGQAQIHRLKMTLAKRSGLVEESRGSDPFGDGDGDFYLSDDGIAIREELTELVCLRYARHLARQVGVLYSSDDLERIYTRPDGSRDDATTSIMRWYHHPSRGGIDSALHLLDQWLVGLRTVPLLCQWVEDLGEISYQVLPPHWVHWWTRPDAPADQRLAYAVAYSEPEALDADGRPIPASAWTAYVRPALPGDPPDAPTREPGFEQTGRLVRYIRKGTPYSDPWPLPDPESGEIQDGGLADGPNPIVAIGGARWNLWSPIILHAAERLTTGLRLPVAVDQCQLGEELDHGMTSALHTANLQGFGQPVFRGAGDPPDKLGPSHIVHVQDASGDFYYRAPEGDPNSHFDLVRKVAQLSSVLECLPADVFTADPPSIETGPAKRMRSAALIQERGRRSVDAERPEHARFQLERIYHNAYGTGDKIPTDTELVMHWGELATPTDWGSRLQEMSTEKSLGISGIIDLVMERHGVDREEARRRVKAMAEDNEENQNVGRQRSLPSVPDAPSGDNGLGQEVEEPAPDNGSSART